MNAVVHSVPHAHTRRIAIEAIYLPGGFRELFVNQPDVSRLDGVRIRTGSVH